MSADRLYLDHILTCIERIEMYTAGADVAVADAKTQDAVLRNLHTLAESTQRLSAEVRATQAHIPWAQVAGSRNVVVHGYLGIDWTLIARILREDLPPATAGRSRHARRAWGVVAD